MTKPNVVNFHYAQLLKENHFASPPLENGQFWYDKYGTLHLISFIDGKFYECDPDSGVMRHEFDGTPTGDGAFFAPSVEYIEELLSPKSNPGALKPGFNTFEKSGVYNKVGYDPNAYAQIWLDENTKPEEE